MPLDVTQVKQHVADWGGKASLESSQAVCGILEEYMQLDLNQVKDGFVYWRSIHTHLDLNEVNQGVA